jgi:REP element-mobilizing transposase RayT
LLLAVQKTKLPFFLYAYCLMTNHVHLLLERQGSAVGRIMHRLLTGYAKYIIAGIDGWDTYCRGGIKQFFVRASGI